MDKYTLEELDEIEEVEIINQVIIDMENAIDNNDIEKLSDYINIIAYTIKSIKRDANYEYISYIIIQFLNKIVSTDTSIRYNVCEVLHEELNRGIDDIKFQKEALLELKKHLKYITKNSQYDDLPLIFSILICILVMRNNGYYKMQVDRKIWESGLSGITYYPGRDAYRNTEEYREPIIEGISKLKRRP